MYRAVVDISINAWPKDLHKVIIMHNTRDECVDMVLAQRTNHSFILYGYLGENKFHNRAYSSWVKKTEGDGYQALAMGVYNRNYGFINFSGKSREFGLPIEPEGIELLLEDLQKRKIALPSSPISVNGKEVYTP